MRILGIDPGIRNTGFARQQALRTSRHAERIADTANIHDDAVAIYLDNLSAQLCDHQRFPPEP